MSGVTKAITDKLYNQVGVALAECSRYGDVSNKLQAIKSAKKFGISHVAEIFEVSRVSIMKWIKSFSDNGVEGLRLKEGRGRKSIITLEEEKLIEVWIQENNGMTIKALRLKIESELGKKLGKSATHNLMVSLGYSYITPRPVHYKQEKSRQAEFKKKSTKHDRSKAK